MRKRIDPKVRFFKHVRVDETTGCWEWTGSRCQGYGRFHFENKWGAAHRFIYAKTKGEILEGSEIDHLCRNRACVNPDHLEAVTHKENCQRGIAGLKARNWIESLSDHEFEQHMLKMRDAAARKQKARGSCKHGHAFTPENTYIKKNGTRDCKICHRLRQRKQKIFPPITTGAIENVNHNQKIHP